MISLKQALIDPASVFKDPKDVLLHNELSRDQKIEILKRWEYDLREISVAIEENMKGDEDTFLLEKVLAALHTLDAKIDPNETPPTKQGG